MVDPIEVKLDEIEDHVLKTQADVDRLMRDFSKPEKAKEILAQIPGGGGGFMDMLIGKMTGGKGAGMMGVGMAGGAAMAGIMVLVDVIKDAIRNSKINSAILGTSSKALGLLIDVILLPFLPILTTGIIWLFQGIMLFHRLWSTIWNSKVMQDIGKALTTVGTIFGKGISALFNIQFGLIGEGAEIIWKVLKWLWETVTGGGIITASLAFILGPVGVLLDWLYNLATGKTTLTATVNFVLGTFGDILQWLYNAVTAPLKINLDFTSNIAEALGLGGVSSAANAIGGAVSDPLGWLGGAMSAIGGAVKGATNASTIVIQGYTDQKLVSTIEAIQRRQNNRYNA